MNNEYYQNTNKAIEGRGEGSACHSIGHAGPKSFLEKKKSIYIFTTGRWPILVLLPFTFF